MKLKTRPINIPQNKLLNRDAAVKHVQYDACGRMSYLADTCCERLEEVAHCPCYLDKGEGR